MTWKKIDDYNSGDTGTPFQPYSAFLAQGLTQNARSYPSELTRGASIPFRADKPVRWASWHEPAGTVVWVNCGANASTIQFRLGYNTDNLHESENDRIGAFFVQSLSTNRVFNIDVPASVVVTSVTLDFKTASAGLQGYQPFFIGFQSDKVFDLGPVDVNYLSGNTIGCGGLPNHDGREVRVVGLGGQLLRDPGGEPKHQSGMAARVRPQ